VAPAYPEISRRIPVRDDGQERRSAVQIKPVLGTILRRSLSQRSAHGEGRATGGLQTTIISEVLSETPRLARYLVIEAVVTRISPDTVRRILERHNLKPWAARSIRPPAVPFMPKLDATALQTHTLVRTAWE
jgi:hypothetical protein